MRSPWYKDSLIVAGTLFLVLGIGNWAAGSLQVRPYAALLDHAPSEARRFESAKESLLYTPDPNERKREIYAAKLDFYRLVASGGRSFVLVGLFLLGGAVFRGSVLSR